MNQNMLFLTIVSTLCLIAISLCTKSLFAQEATHKPPLSFDEYTIYNIYYEVSNFEVDAVKRVKITGLVTVNGNDFLEIEEANYYGHRDNEVEKGYILFSSIRAMLPSGHIEPERTFLKGQSNKVIIPPRRKE